jgi:hypothetical protein
MRRAPHWLIGLLVMTGCQQVERLRECRAIADSVNPELEQLARTFSSRGSISAAEYRSAAAGYVRAAKRLENLHPHDAELARLARELRVQLMATSRSCDRFAASATAGGNEAQREFDALTNHHHALIVALGRRCGE